MEWLIILGVLGAFALTLITIYNRLVALRQNRNNAYADIDVQLTQRFELIPNLVETVKGYAGHEKRFLRMSQNTAPVSAMPLLKMNALLPRHNWVKRLSMFWPWQKPIRN